MVRFFHSTKQIVSIVVFNFQFFFSFVFLFHSLVNLEKLEKRELYASKRNLFDKEWEKTRIRERIRETAIAKKEKGKKEKGKKEKGKKEKRKKEKGKRKKEEGKRKKEKKK